MWSPTTTSLLCQSAHKTKPPWQRPEYAIQFQPGLLSAFGLQFFKVRAEMRPAGEIKAYRFGESFVQTQISVPRLLHYDQGVAAGRECKAVFACARVGFSKFALR